MKLRKPPIVINGALNNLIDMNWNGNVRELENIVEREIIYRDGGPLEFNVASTKEVLCDEHTHIEQTTPALNEIIKKHIQHVMDECNGRVEGEKGAANVLKVNPSTLRKKMNRLGILFGRKSNKTNIDSRLYPPN